VFAFIIGILAAIAAIVAFGLRRRAKSRLKRQGDTDDGHYDYGREPEVIGAGLITLIVGVLTAVVAVIALTASVVYTQDAGEAKVKVDVAGNITGQTTTTGFHTKFPWESTHTFNIRNQTVTYINAADGDTSDNNGGQRSGPYISVQASDGVTSTVSLSLRYSIRSETVTDVYREFRDEENFKKSFIEQDVRSVVRSVPTQYTTIELLTERDRVEDSILKALEDRWADDGVIVDSISLQEFVPPTEVSESYAAIQTETNKLEAAKVKAQQQVATAQGQADANAILNSQPLSDVSIQQRYIEALKTSGENGGLIVVPEGSTPLLNVGK